MMYYILRRLLVKKYKEIFFVKACHLRDRNYAAMISTSKHYFFSIIGKVVSWASGRMLSFDLPFITVLRQKLMHYEICNLWSPSGQISFHEQNRVSAQAASFSLQQMTMIMSKPISMSSSLLNYLPCLTWNCGEFSAWHVIPVVFWQARAPSSCDIYYVQSIPFISPCIANSNILVHMSNELCNGCKLENC